MYKLFFIAKNNMKKQRSDMITFFILTFIAALLIFDCASAILGMGKILDDKFNSVNGAHFQLFAGDSEAETDSALKAISENKYITDYEKTPVIWFATNYKKASDDEYSSFDFLVEDYDENKRIMNVTIPEFGHNKDDILIPYNLKTRFDIGDKMQIKIGDDVYNFNVAGYLEDPYFCSTMNITTYYCSINKEMIDTLAKKHPETVRRYNAFKGIADTEAFPAEYNTEDLESEILDIYKRYLTEHKENGNELNFTGYFAINWDLIKGGSEFVPMIVMVILLLFAMIILVVALIIISFSIKNFIQRNMKNTGIMEAAGYTVSELRWALTLEITLVAFIGSLTGISVGILTFKSFGNILSMILGLSWTSKADIGVAVLTLIAMVCVVMLVSRLINRTYKKISVLDALRGGINAHNYKKNVFPFEKTALPVPFVISLKDTFGSLGKNIAMVFISMVLVIALLAGFGIKENYGNDPKPLLNMMGFEMATANVVNRDGGDISDDLKALPGVKNVLVQFGFEPNIIFNGKKNQVYTYAVDDFNNTLSTNMLEGRMPEKENEIMVTNGVALDLGAKVGDVVEIDYAGKKANYIITGINQRIERMGRTIYMRIDGAKMIVPGDLTYTYRYLITAEQNYGFDMIKAEVDKYASAKNISIVCEDLNKVMENTVDTVNITMNAICMVILVLTVLIVIFVESLVIRAKINREWRNLGISKALGQTSLGLMIQIMLTNIPAITVGALIGALLAESAGRSLTKACFTIFAMKEALFEISLSAIFIGVAGIIAVAVITSFLTGLKVRKLIPVEMICEE